MVERPDLLLMWTKCEHISLDLLIRVSTVLDSKYSRRNGISSKSGLCHGQSLRFTFNGEMVYDDERFCFSSVQWENCRKYLTGKGKEYDKHWENVIKKWYDEETSLHRKNCAGFSDPTLKYASFEVEKRKDLKPTTDLSSEDQWLVSVAENASIEVTALGQTGTESTWKSRRRKRADTEKYPRGEKMEHNEYMSISECCESPTIPPDVVDDLALEMVISCELERSLFKSTESKAELAQQSPSLSRPKKMPFTPRRKFRRLIDEIEKSKESVKPWSLSPSPSSASLSLIQIEESQQNSDKRKQKERKQKSPSKSQKWTAMQVTSSSSSSVPSLQSIMHEEEERRKETRRIKKRPLQFVAAEEQAMSELLLYQQSFGEDVIVNVQRCTADVQEPIWA